MIFYQLDKAWAGHTSYLQIVCLVLHNPFIEVTCNGPLGPNNTDMVILGPLNGSPATRMNDPDYWNVQGLANLFQGCSCPGIAGNDQHLDAFFKQEAG